MNVLSFAQGPSGPIKTKTMYTMSRFSKANCAVSRNTRNREIKRAWKATIRWAELAYTKRQETMI